MKKITAFFSILLLSLALCVPVLASGAYVVDRADLITSDAEVKIQAALEKISADHKMDVVVMTTNTTDGESLMSYADRYYDSNGYAKDGVLLLINTDTAGSGETRGYWLSTSGKGINVFTDAGIEYIGTQISGYMSNGDFDAAAARFAQLTEDYITHYETTGRGYDYGEMPYDTPKKTPWVMMVIIALAVGLIIGLITANSQKAAHKTIRTQTRANRYVVDNRLTLTGHTDTFLYRDVARMLLAAAAGAAAGAAMGGRPGNRPGGSTTHLSGGPRGGGFGGGGFSGGGGLGGGGGTIHGGGGGKF